MTLHMQWMKFKRTCLRGATREQITSAKNCFFAGATAGMFELKEAAGLYIAEHATGMDARQRLINARFTELEDFKRYVEKRDGGK